LIETITELGDSLAKEWLSQKLDTKTLSLERCDELLLEMKVVVAFFQAGQKCAIQERKYWVQGLAVVEATRSSFTSIVVGQSFVPRIAGVTGTDLLDAEKLEAMLDAIQSYNANVLHTKANDMPQAVQNSAARIILEIVQVSTAHDLGLEASVQRIASFATISLELLSLIQDEGRKAEMSMLLDAADQIAGAMKLVAKYEAIGETPQHRLAGDAQLALSKDMYSTAAKLQKTYDKTIHLQKIPKLKEIACRMDSLVGDVMVVYKKLDGESVEALLHKQYNPDAPGDDLTLTQVAGGRQDGKVWNEGLKADCNFKAVAKIANSTLNKNSPVALQKSLHGLKSAWAAYKANLALFGDKPEDAILQSIEAVAGSGAVTVLEGILLYHLHNPKKLNPPALKAALDAEAFKHKDIFSNIHPSIKAIVAMARNMKQFD
jgi:hypothetical protein